MDGFDCVSYTADHIQHFGERLKLVYPSVKLSAALATEASKALLLATVEAAWSRDLGSRSATADLKGRVITSTDERDCWLFPEDEAEGVPLRIAFVT